MTSNGTHFPFDEGLPTKPDVDLLLKTWPTPKIGDRFEYEAIEKLLGLKRSDVRFRTITNNWRNRLQDLGFVVECQAAEAFFVASFDEISGGVYGTLRGIGRKAHRQRRKLALAKAESDQQRGVIEHQARLMLAVERDAKKARMNLLPAAPVADAPRIAPPQKPAKKA